jgi:Fic family protein
MKVSGRMDGLGFTWDRNAIPSLRSGISHTEIVHNFKKNIPEFVWNTAALEGNTFSFPEVQSLMDGVPVGGRTLHEVHQIEDTAAAYAWLLDAVQNGNLDWGRHTSDTCNGILARREALVAGRFRTSQVSVRLGDRGVYEPPNVADLEDYYRAGIAALERVDRDDERALAYFAFGARAQFYFDGNKRTSRHIMNGILMSSGHHAIIVPNARRIEFDEACVTMYANDDATRIMQFLTTCSL